MLKKKFGSRFSSWQKFYRILICSPALRLCNLLGSETLPQLAFLGVEKKAPPKLNNTMYKLLLISVILQCMPPLSS